MRNAYFESMANDNEKQIKKTINDKQEAFCQEYCRNGYNGSEAYRTAYPKAKTGHSASAARLLANVSIKDRIAEIKEENEAWSGKNKELLDKLFMDRYRACVAKGDNTNAIRCLENKGRNVGFYEEDNKQSQESAELKELQRQDIEDYKAWKRRQMLKPAS